MLSSPLSRVLVTPFVRRNGIDMSPYEVPIGGYASFNDFFTRRLKVKPIGCSGSALLSPCDGLLTVSPIEEGCTFRIKNTEYDLGDLLGDETLEKEFCGGTAFIFRLTPAHYHRYMWAVGGMLRGSRAIRGVLHSVKPICHREADVFIRNSREYSVVESDCLGKVIQMEVGALLVGRISNHPAEEGSFVEQGSEKGCFEFGGSSIVVLLSRKTEMIPQIKKRPMVKGEIPVAIGEKLIGLQDVIL